MNSKARVPAELVTFTLFLPGILVIVLAIAAVIVIGRAILVLADISR